MYVVTTNDPNQLLQLAKQGATVRVARIGVAIPSSSGFRPGLQLQYWTHAPGDLGDPQWTYTETVEADNRGHVDLRGTLLGMLVSAGLQQQVSLVEVSGSL